MKFSDFWDKVLKGKSGHNLANDNDTLEIKVSEFRRLMKLSFKAGRTSKKSLFEEIFGKTKWL